MPIEPAWARCDEDTRGLEAGRGGGARGRVRNERRGNSANSKAEAVLVMKRNMSNRGELGWWRREGRAARRLLYTFQLSLNPSETVGVSQVERKTKTNKQTVTSFGRHSFAA